MKFKRNKTRRFLFAAYLVCKLTDYDTAAGLNLWQLTPALRNEKAG
jgi:hypothetical protein